MLLIQENLMNMFSKIQMCNVKGNNCKILNALKLHDVDTLYCFTDKYIHYIYKIIYLKFNKMYFIAAIYKLFITKISLSLKS